VTPAAPSPGEGASDAPKSEDLLTTGDMARLTDSTLRTVRFYEEAGILRPTRRTEGGHRLFAREELERLRLVADMREAGLSLDDIRSLLELKLKAASGGEAARGATVALEGFLGALRGKIELLKRLEVDLAETVMRTQACLGCEQAELFPHRCGECEKLLAMGPAPRGLRVLWGMGDTRSEEAPSASDQDEAPVLP
jgi:DNA-binding transcriptional MerR regulator